MELNPRRNFAFLIDVIIYGAFFLVPMFVGQSLPEPFSRVSEIGIPLSVLYMVFRDGFRGQSIGKRIMKVRLVHQDSGAPISFWTAFVRGFFTSLPVLGWIDFFLVAFTRDRQRYTDKLLRVQLVKV
jgi:uncharacterized RDD family membrane protein YckC